MLFKAMSEDDGTSKNMELRILPIADGDEVKLSQQMGSPEREHKSYLRLQEEGKATYLVAWEATTPVGHLLIRWGGSLEVPRIVDRMPNAAKFGNYPCFDRIEVRRDRRGHGIGTSLIKCAEDVVRERGYEYAMIEVDIVNIRARALYERLSYIESGLGEYTTSGTYSDDDGHLIDWINGPQVMLIKRILATRN